MTSVVTVNSSCVPIGHIASASRSISVGVVAEHAIAARRVYRGRVDQHARPRR